MTIPEERIQVAIEVREFLLSLTQPELTPAVPSEIRERAAQLLKNYPGMPPPQSIEPECRNLLGAAGESENNTPAYDEAQWKSMKWLERLLADPARTRDIVANAGLIASIFLLVGVAVTSYFLR